jgi:hypothetical protein
MILGPLFGIYLPIYAFGIWRQKRWALPALRGVRAYQHDAVHAQDAASMGLDRLRNLYAAVALGVSWGSAILLTQPRAQLA